MTATPAWGVALALSASLLGACGGEDPTDHMMMASPDGGADGGAGGDMAPPPGGRWPATPIRHVVVLVQENHTFDSYFGRYCTGPAGVSCTSGAACCEAGPREHPAGTTVRLLDAASNYKKDRNHESACELAEMNWDGQRYRMDRFVSGSGISGCSDPDNFAMIDPSQDDTGVSTVYWPFARRYAMADRFFQPVVGSTSSNDMYLATAQFHFIDNQAFPSVLGTECQLSYHKYLPDPIDQEPVVVSFFNTTIADLLIQSPLTQGTPFGFYHQGYRAMHEAKAAGRLDRDGCPPLPADCQVTAAKLNAAPCSYDPSDNPFRYFGQFADGSEYAARYLHDYNDLAQDLAAGRLPVLAFVKALSYTNEHPNWSHIYEGTRLADQAVRDLLDPRYGETVEGRFVPYAESTLVLLTWDEGGGFFDHVPPPRQAPVDGRPYGTRVPLLALGRFAKKGYVSHVPLEHSSIVKFVEWNFLGRRSGQLAERNHPTPFGGPFDMPRDRLVNNLGDLLDPAETQVPVPSGTDD